MNHDPDVQRLENDGTIAARPDIHDIRIVNQDVNPDAFFEIAKRFYGKRFAGPVKSDYRALCSTLQRAA